MLFLFKKYVGKWKIWLKCVKVFVRIIIQNLSFTKTWTGAKIWQTWNGISLNKRVLYCNWIIIRKMGWQTKIKIQLINF